MTAISARLGSAGGWAVRQAANLFGAAAAGSGTLVRLGRKVAPSVPGIAGACLVAWGIAQIYTPAGWLAGGLFLIWADLSNPTRVRGS